MTFFLHSTRCDPYSLTTQIFRTVPHCVSAAGRLVDACGAFGASILTHDLPCLRDVLSDHKAHDR